MSDNNDGYLRISEISKTFGAVRALKNISFSVRKGEIHTILGENGAGKSTLVKTIMGEINPDNGTIELDGKAIKIFSPLYARDCGIQMVHQELAVFENMTVAENIFPWNDYRTSLKLVDWNRLNAEAQQRLDLFGLKNVQPEQLMRNLTLDVQQMVEILRCISADHTVLLLDEPTSGLNDEETSKLMAILKHLRDEGETILYISHRLQEILEISDSVTILRDGEYINTLPNDNNMTEDVLINSMVGRDLSSTLYRQKVYNRIDDDILFEAIGLNKKNALYDAGFKLKKGEVLGFFGLEGSGIDILSRILYGLGDKDSGEIHYKGEQISRVEPDKMIEKKILYLNTNRKMAGLLLDMPAIDNIAMAILKKISMFSFINFSKLKAISKKYIDYMSIVIPSVKTHPRNLSGGNQQKVMMSICLAAEPDLLIVNEPTRGIDVGAKAEIHKLLLETAKKGVGVIVFSSELPELMSLADRVVVMKNNRISGEVLGDDIGENSIMMLAAGGEVNLRSELI